MDAANELVGSLSFIGNATTLIHLGPFTLLTDPNFLHRGERAYLGHGLTSKRLTEPSLDITDLPPLDAVVLSHLHGDHWDRVSRRHLDKGLPVLTTPHAARRLRLLHGFGNAQGLRTWTTRNLSRDGHTLHVTSLPGRHGPGAAQLMMPPVMGSLLELAGSSGQTAYRLYITGDTLMYDGIADIARRTPDLDLAVVHLGGTTLGGLMVTMDGRQGRELIELVRPRTAVPIHFDDYTVFKSPLADFRREMEQSPLGERVTYVERGQTVPLKRQGGTAPASTRSHSGTGSAGGAPHR